MLFIRRLIWDAANVPHIARHGLSLEAIEEVCHGLHIVREGYNGRIMVVGPTAAGRFVAVILAPRGHDVYYPVTAYPASRRLRRIYEQEKGEATR